MRLLKFGTLEKESLKSILDLNTREKWLLYPLVVLVIFYGIYPSPVFDVTQASVDNLINTYQAAVDGAVQAAQAAGN